MWWTIETNGEGEARDDCDDCDMYIYIYIYIYTRRCWIVLSTTKNWWNDLKLWKVHIMPIFISLFQREGKSSSTFVLALRHHRHFFLKWLRIIWSASIYITVQWSNPFSNVDVLDFIIIRTKQRIHSVMGFFFIMISSERINESLTYMIICWIVNKKTSSITVNRSNLF